MLSQKVFDLFFAAQVAPTDSSKTMIASPCKYVVNHVVMA
jgi:hypothetical protein